MCLKVQMEIVNQGEDDGTYAGRNILQKLLADSESDEIACDR